MLVSPPPFFSGINLIKNEQKLYQFLLNCQAEIQHQGISKWITLSQSIELIDPLLLLRIYPQNQPHFYWENPRQNSSVIALSAVESIKCNPDNRFEEAKEFIHQQLEHNIQIGEGSDHWSRPCFFASFTFFAHCKTVDCLFPSGMVFLPKIQVSRHKNKSHFVYNFILHPQSSLELILQDFRENLQKIQSINTEIIPYSEQKSIAFSPKTTLNSSHFKNSVKQALQFIEQNQISKIVLSHILDIISPQSFLLVESLNNLRLNHPDCYIFSVGNNEGNQFIGASPERLLSIHNHHLFTDALAGSAPRGKTPLEDHTFAYNLLHNEKEQREHKAVINFIIKQLQDIHLSPQKSPLKLLKLPHIQHLWTPITAHLPHHLHPLDLVKKLHPTPAVAGVPTDIACEQIRYYETFDRSLYASPIGWIDNQGNGEFIVGIRSALLTGNHARLYAGAGIVSGSDPDKELAETQLKFQTIFKSLV